MEQKGDSWYCAAGEMALPKFVMGEINAALEKSANKRLENRDDLEAGMAGYCVRCATELLISQPALQICPRCSLSVPHSIFYVLQEYNYHKSTDEHYVVKWQKLKAVKK